jgi:hypothetical protein
MIMTSLSSALPSYTYQPLSPQTIRVLELHPGASDAPLACNITIQRIGDQSYEALSYVWGDPTAVASIKCIDSANQGYLGICRSLAKLLVAFRLTDQPRRIWVDALSINQKDVHERESQVRLMGAVYRQAKHVLCWLGPFKYLGHGGDDSQKDHAAAELSARLSIEFLRKFNDNPYENLQAARQHLHAGDDMADRATADSLLSSWLAIKDLFDLEYFHRTWIIQEMGLAAHARIFWGSRDLWLEWTEVATFCKFMDDNGASIINHLQLKSWVANHINLVWATDSNGNTIHTFVEVLHWARVHRSTDPRDCVFALLSHPSATMNGSLVIQPNYTIPTSQVYTEVALNVIERTNSLQILAFVDHHEEPSSLSLPTWVPDWHALNLVAPLRCPVQAATETDTSITVTETAKGIILKCRGVLIDSLRAMSDIIEPSELTITTLEKEMQKKLPFLIDHIWTKTIVEPDIPHASLDYLLASLSLVLTGGFLDVANSTSGKEQEQQMSDLAALVLEYDRIREDGHTDGIYVNLPPIEKQTLESMAAKGSAHQFVQDMTWTSMCRRVFRTAKGHIGLGPRTMKEGDICIVAWGAVYPMILRQRDDYFELIGPALLYSFMNGEAAQLCRSGTLPEQGFEII